MKTENAIITKDLREKLKTIMANEIDTLPETLESLTPAERINVVLKLMPFVVPKVETVTHDLGEPLSF